MRRLRGLAWLAVLGVVASSCGPAPASPTPRPIDTVAPTPVRASSTTAPTPRPAPTATPNASTAGPVATAGVQATRAPATVVPAAAQATRVPPTAVAAPRVSPFGRRDVPPAAVAGLLTFWSQGATGNCQMEVGRSTPLSSCEAIIPQHIELQFIHFAPNADIDVQITRADGKLDRRRVQVNRDGWARTDLFALPGDPPGVYAIAASEGSRRTAGTIDIQIAVRGERRMMVAPDTAAPGTAINVALGGFEPGRTIPLHLYQRASPLAGTVTYLSQLGTTTASARGEATFAIQTRADDPEGHYAVETEPPSADVFTSLFQLTHRPGRGEEQRDAAAELRAAMVAVIGEANRVWASAVSKDRPPLAMLERVFGEPLLSDVREEITVMRNKGQHRDARVRRVDILSVRQLPQAQVFAAYEVIAAEEWDDRLLNADGSVAEVMPSRATWRYHVELLGPWLITDVQPVARQ